MHFFSVATSFLTAVADVTGSKPAPVTCSSSNAFSTENFCENCRKTFQPRLYSTHAIGAVAVRREAKTPAFISGFGYERVARVHRLHLRPHLRCCRHLPPRRCRCHPSPPPPAGAAATSIFATNAVAPSIAAAAKPATADADAVESAAAFAAAVSSFAVAAATEPARRGRRGRRRRLRRRRRGQWFICFRRRRGGRRRRW